MVQRVFWNSTANLRKQSVEERCGEWTDCIMDKILKKVEIQKFITTALKSILKLVKLQSLVAKRKMWKM